MAIYPLRNNPLFDAMSVVWPLTYRLGGDPRLVSIHHSRMSVSMFSI
jgi:hypothetical protein